MSTALSPIRSSWRDTTYIRIPHSSIRWSSDAASTLKGAQTRSCSSPVLVKQTAQQVASMQRASMTLPGGWSAGPANLALVARVRGGAGGRCNAGRRPAGPGQGGCARGSAASPGTRPAPYGSNAPHTRSPWALGPGSPALPRLVSGTRRRSCGRTSRRGRAGQSAPVGPARPGSAAGCGLAE
jgi:hypothetical protein